MTKKAPATKKPPKRKRPRKPAKATGRPTSYREDFPDLARRLCLLGATDEALAKFFDVNVDTIYEWKKRHEAFSEAVKKGKDFADMEIAERLFHRAAGVTVIEQKEVKLKTVEYADGKKVAEREDVKVVELQRELPPDTTAGIFWLKNRQPKKWRDRHHHTVRGEEGPVQEELALTPMTPEDAYKAMLEKDGKV